MAKTFTSHTLLLELLDLIFEKKYFRFHENYYMQIKDIAMDCTAVPSLANMFMATLEYKFIYNPSNNPYFSDITVFRRCIDDLFFVLRSEVVVEGFCTWINDLDGNIKFSWQYNQKASIFEHQSVKI